MAPVLTITGATADGTCRWRAIWRRATSCRPTNVPTVDHLIQFAAGTVANEPLAAEYFGLKLIDSTVSATDLKAYYAARGVPEPFLTYLNVAADGTNPFVYIKGSTVTLVDAAKHAILSHGCGHDGAGRLPAGHVHGGRGRSGMWPGTQRR